MTASRGVGHRTPAVLAAISRAQEAFAAKQRARTHCKRDHEFTEENTYWKDGNRNCKECRRGHVRRWRSENRELANRRTVDSLRKKATGVTPEVYDAMVEAQDGRCAICHRVSQQSLCVDHCHATGRVRGLLCHDCNVALGRFHDDPQRLAEAVAYLIRV